MVKAGILTQGPGIIKKDRGESFEYMDLDLGQYDDDPTDIDSLTDRRDSMNTSSLYISVAPNIDSNNSPFACIK